MGVGDSIYHNKKECHFIFTQLNTLREHFGLEPWCKVEIPWEQIAEEKWEIKRNTCNKCQGELEILDIIIKKTRTSISARLMSYALIHIDEVLTLFYATKRMQVNYGLFPQKQVKLKRNIACRVQIQIVKDSGSSISTISLLSNTFKIKQGNY